MRAVLRIPRSLGTQEQAKDQEVGNQTIASLHVIARKRKEDPAATAQKIRRGKGKAGSSGNEKESTDICLQDGSIQEMGAVVLGKHCRKNTEIIMVQMVEGGMITMFKRWKPQSAAREPASPKIRFQHPRSLSAASTLPSVDLGNNRALLV